MSRIDYYGIQAAIAEVLRNDPTLEGVVVEVERDVSFQRGDVVMVYLDSREVPARSQTLSAGQTTKMEVIYSIWCFHWGLDVQQVLRARDDLMGRVEIVLMKNRTLSNTVESSRIEGGKFDSRTGQDQFMSGGEIRLRADVVATTQ